MEQPTATVLETETSKAETSKVEASVHTDLEVSKVDFSFVPPYSEPPQSLLNEGEGNINTSQVSNSEAP